MELGLYLVRGVEIRLRLNQRVFHVHSIYSSSTDEERTGSLSGDLESW